MGIVAQPPRGGVTWTLAGERLGLLAWPRAILLQLAHPLVAAGVGEHSDFRGSAIAPYTRLHATVTAMRRIAFGSPADAELAVGGILRVHDRVHGTLGEDAGAHRRGTPYSAHDPALLLWVHATLIDSYARVLGELLEPLSDRERDAYCRESAPLAERLGAPADRLPDDWPALQHYIDGELASGRVAVGAEARSLAHAVLRPPLGWLVWPVSRASALITIGALPDTIRAQYGFPWTGRHERRRRRVVALIRRARRWTPDALARWPEARGSR